MARLEDLKQGANVNGILPNQQVTVVNVSWFGTSVIELTYRDASGNLGNQLIYRDNEPELEIVDRRDARGVLTATGKNSGLFRKPTA